MNKALLDTDILSEISKGIDVTAAQNAKVYRLAHGFLTLSVISVMEVIQGYQRVGGSNRIQAFRNAVATEEILSFDKKLPILPVKLPVILIELDGRLAVATP